MGHIGGSIPPWVEVVSTPYGIGMDFIGIVLGVVMGMIILLVLHKRRRALRDESNLS
ncbi:hypothetical protein J6TS2_42820 [Heyndrickxia sporothermodurans]|nr:hypothetical protein J6TS2_42820 [Heyndrickxia sporothermodurans]